MSLIVYRHKTRSDEILSLDCLQDGLIVWVSILGGSREPRITTGANGELLTLEEYRQRRAEKAARNRAKHQHVSWKSRHKREYRSLGVLASA